MRVEECVLKCFEHMQRMTKKIYMSEVGEQGKVGHKGGGVRCAQDKVNWRNVVLQGAMNQAI